MLKKTIISVVTLVLVFGLGMLAGIKLKSQSAVNKAGQPDTFQAGYDAAKKRLQEQGIGTLPVMLNKIYFGTVQKISGNSIVVKTATVIDPLSDPNLDFANSPSDRWHENISVNPKRSSAIPTRNS